MTFEGFELYLSRTSEGKRNMGYKNIWLFAILGLFCICVGVFITMIGVSVLSSDVGNVFARVIMAAFGIQSIATTVVGVFFTAAGIYSIAWGLIVWLALLTRSPILEQIVFGKKSR